MCAREHVAYTHIYTCGYNLKSFWYSQEHKLDITARNLWVCFLLLWLLFTQTLFIFCCEGHGMLNTLFIGSGSDVSITIQVL